MSLDSNQLQLLSERLLKETERLEAELASVSHRTKEGLGYTASFPDIGTSDEDSVLEVQEFSLNVDLEKKMEKDLGLVRKALEKIRKGSFGVCERCGNAIADERLLVLPEAEFCSDCFGGESAAA